MSQETEAEEMRQRCSADFDAMCDAIFARWKIRQRDILAVAGSRSATMIRLRSIIVVALRDRGYSYPAIGDTIQRDHTSAMRMYRAAQTSVRDESRDILRHARELAASLSGDPVQQPPVVTTDTPARNGDDTWKRAVAEYRTARVGEQTVVWEGWCRKMYPTSWQAQAAMPPGPGA